MKKQLLRRISLLLHSLYGFICLLLIFFMKAMSLSYETRQAALNIWYGTIMAWGAILLAGLFLNIFAMPKKETGKSRRAIWLIWTILAPILLSVLVFLPPYIMLGRVA